MSLAAGLPTLAVHVLSVLPGPAAGCLYGRAGVDLRDEQGTWA